MRLVITRDARSIMSVWAWSKRKKEEEKWEDKQESGPAGNAKRSMATGEPEWIFLPRASPAGRTRDKLRTEQNGRLFSYSTEDGVSDIGAERREKTTENNTRAHLLRPFHSTRTRTMGVLLARCGFLSFIRTRVACDCHHDWIAREFASCLVLFWGYRLSFLRLSH